MRNKECSWEDYRVIEIGHAGKYGIVAGKWYKASLLMLINEKLISEGFTKIDATNDDEDYDRAIKRLGGSK